MQPQVEEDPEGVMESSEEKRGGGYHATLLRYGYEEVKVIAKSLQGAVVEARRTPTLRPTTRL